MGPLAFLSLFLAMWLSVRVQVLRKEIEGLELRRETLVVQVAERRRAVEERMAFAEMEPQVRAHGFRAPERDQVVLLRGASDREDGGQWFPLRVLDFLSNVPPARANANATGAEPVHGAAGP